MPDKYLKERLKNLRNEILKEAWENHKAVVSMQELAEMFNLSLASTYRIIKERSENNK